MAPVRRTLRAVTAVVALSVVLAAPSRAQTVRVGLEVTENTDGLFRQSFDSALDALEDVEVVGPSEPADYVITVAVLCRPDSEVCESARRYSVSVTLSVPLVPARLRSGLDRTGTDVLSGWDASPEAAAYLQRFRQMHSAWATSWARDGYGPAVARLVGGIDARCFEKHRIFRTRRQALLRRGDTATARNLTVDVVPGEDWLC